jgi:hypothetical protein
VSLEEQLRNDAQSLREVGWFNRAIMMDAAANEIQKLNERIKRMESFINRFLDPEDLGYAVNNYVRDDAREALGRERVESKP